MQYWAWKSDSFELSCLGFLSQWIMPIYGVVYRGHVYTFATITLRVLLKLRWPLIVDRSPTWQLFILIVIIKADGVCNWNCVDVNVHMDNIEGHNLVQHGVIDPHVIFQSFENSRQVSECLVSVFLFQKHTRLFDFWMQNVPHLNQDCWKASDITLQSELAFENSGAAHATVPGCVAVAVAVLFTIFPSPKSAILPLPCSSRMLADFKSKCAMRSSWRV